MKRLFSLVFILFSLNAYSQFAMGVEGGYVVNLLDDRFEVANPVYGVQIHIGDLVTLNYSTENVASIGVMEIVGNRSSRGLARTCKDYNSSGFTWGLEASYSFNQERGGVGLIFGYKFGRSNILTLRTNTIDGVKLGYMYRF